MKKFIADESVDFRIIKSLRGEGYEVKVIVEINSGITDDEVLRIANELEAILLTEDKDFGELTFRFKKPNKGIILIRMVSVPIEERIEKIKSVISKYIDQLEDSFTIITPNKLRIKKKKES